ncbi:MAG: hypothetical protein AMXMBFR47_15480 [Planctomycetota bacterium]
MNIERITSRDGARIACKRRPGPGTPVILLHGLAVNADLWDIPDIDAPGCRYRSLASVLHAAGYDLWLMNHRGCGRPHMLSEPPEGQADWCVDHSIVFDFPAVAGHVQRATGRRPFLIGNSLGAMTIAAYLQGAVIVGYGDQETIIADENAARNRARETAGAVLIEFPAALRWPRSAFSDGGGLNWGSLWPAGQGDQNLAFEFLSRFGWLEGLIRSAGSVRLDWLRGAGDLAGGGAFSTWLKTTAMQWYSTNIKGAANFSAETFVNGLLRAADTMKSGVLRQLSKSVRMGGFVSSLGTPDHVYSEHYDLIESPVFVIAGGRDHIASAETTRTVFFDRVRTADRTFQLFETMSHGEFEYAPIATERVYPQILEWIRARDTAATQ